MDTPCITSESYAGQRMVQLLRLGKIWNPIYEDIYPDLDKIVSHNLVSELTSLGYGVEAEILFCANERNQSVHS